MNLNTSIGFFIVLFTGLSVASSLTSCQPSSKAKYTFRIGHVANEDHTWHQAFEHFGEILKERSNGQIEVQVYPAEQLGKEQELVRSIKAGIADMTITGGTLQNWCEIASFSDMPFLIRDSEHLRKIADGEIGRRMNETILEETDLRVVAIFERGARNLTSNRPIKHPDELNGLLLRIPNVPSYVSAWSAMGAKPTPMAFSEVFTSLQQGTIEAQENPYAMISSASFYEVQKYLNLTEHVISWGMIVVGEKQFQALPKDLQEVFLQAARDMQEYEHQIFTKKQDELMASLKENGMEFIEVDQAAFREKAGEAIFNSLPGDMQEVYREIVELE